MLQQSFSFQDMDNKGLLIHLNITVGTQVFKASLYNNPTSQSLLDQLPFTVEVEDYAGIEKVFYPNPALSTEQAPSGAEASVGDMMYYTPWGDVAIFYKDFKYASGLIPMGKMEDVRGFVNALVSSTTVTFEIK
ncbi:cyclophilin-like fold protein [Limibacter armeniacum]|uniref:cyclophilin-like fold protein n=1 Tax=Limibacter armeniacum TaxID=466084 RepID=UPI002FE68987